MWLKCEVGETDDAGEVVPLAMFEAAVADERQLGQYLAHQVPVSLTGQLKWRRLDGRLARHMAELAARLFPGQEIPARKAEARLGWTPEGRPCLVVLVRGDFAGQWWDALTGARGGPLELVQRAAPAPEGPEARLGVERSQAWAEAFLAEVEGAQGDLPATGPAAGAAKPTLVASHPDAPAVDDSGAGGEAA